MESGFKCGSGEPGSSFCVMMDILYHVPHLCGGFFAIFNELNSNMNIDYDDYAIQLYFPMYSDARFHVRRKTNGTWQEWKINM